MTPDATWKVLLAALSLALTAPAGAEPVGFVAGLRGEAELRAGGAAFLPAQLDQDVSEGDVLRTGRAGWAKVVLNDDTTFAVDEETELVFDRYTVGSLSSSPSRFEVLSGHVRTKVGEAFGGSPRLKLHTPTAVIGVKGTEWLTWVERNDTWVCVLEGVVGTSNRNPAVGTHLDVTPGQCARIGRDRAPIRTPIPAHLEPTAMRLPHIAPASSFPASFDPIDRTPIERNDLTPRIELPEPEPPPARVVLDTPPAAPPPVRGNLPPLTNLP